MKKLLILLGLLVVSIAMIWTVLIIAAVYEFFGMMDTFIAWVLLIFG